MFFFRFARSRFGSNLIPWFFAHLSFLLPVKREIESDNFVAFHHPWPSYPVHLLLVPKKPIAGINELGEEDNGVLLEIMKTAQNLVEKSEPKGTGYRLVLNAGAYQEVPQLHFHLILDEPTKITNEH